MGYWTSHEEVNDPGCKEPRDDIMGVLTDDPDKEVDYLAVVLFIFRLLYTKLTTSELSDVLDIAAEHIPGKHTAICTNTVGRARLAVGLVDAFLLKDSFTRGLKKE